MRKLWVGIVGIVMAAGCEDEGVHHLADAPVMVDADPNPPDAPHPPACPLNGEVVVHQTDITTDELWAGDGTLHHVKFGITIRPGATLTIAACATVSVDPGLQLTVTGMPGQPAKLATLGGINRPVVMRNHVDGQKWGGWRGLNADSTFELRNTVFNNGGVGMQRGAVLDVRGNGASERDLVPLLLADDLAILGSVGTGLVMTGGASFMAGSTQLRVMGGGASVLGGDYAIEINPIAAGTLPPLTISGNAHDAIKIAAGSLFISTDLTLKKLGVPYYFSFDRVRITDPMGGTPPTLTIEPGVELRFDDELQVGFINPGVTNQPGKLIALGTAAEPIVFTSSKTVRAAGDWPGIWLYNAPGSRLENVRIEYAGGPNGIVSSNCKPANTSDASAIFIGTSGGGYIPLASDFVGVTIANSASHGINAMWSAATFAPDLTAGFTFQTISGCSQTKNARTTGCGTEAGCLVP